MSPPCHYLNDNYCKQASVATICSAQPFEKAGTCKTAGFPVCCKGHHNIHQLWFKSGTDCAKEEGDPGDPLSPC